MRSWNYTHSLSGYSVTISEGPWWSFVPEAISNTVFGICDKMPTWQIKKHPDPIEDWSYTLHDLFHLYICNPISQWSFRVESKHQIEYRLDIPTSDLVNLCQSDFRFREFYNQCQSIEDVTDDEDTQE